MPIKTPDILPGEPGYISKKERTAQKKVKEKKMRQQQRKKETNIGRIKTGKLRIGRPSANFKGEKKYLVWRFRRKVGEIISKGDEVSLKFFRFGGIGDYKNLIRDADFRKAWMIREQELLMTQKRCYLCKKKLSPSAIPNLYHYHLWKKRAHLIEEAEKIPQKVVSGKLTLEDGWKQYHNFLEEVNRYYMSLKETALVCATCAKQKGLKY